MKNEDNIANVLTKNVKEEVFEKYAKTMNKGTVK